MHKKKRKFEVNL